MFYLSDKEETPTNILNSMEDIKIIKNKNNHFDLITEEINKTVEKVNELLKIIDSDDFKNLDETDEKQKDLKNQIIKELEDNKIKFENLKESQNNTIEISLKQQEINNKERLENQKKAYEYNYKLYKHFKDDKNKEIPDVFIYIFKIYDIIENLNIEDENKFDEFIKLYQSKYDYSKDIKKDLFNIFLDEELFY